MSSAAPGPLLEQLEAALPKLQCGKCGYPDCRSYATAMRDRAALPNRCTPGGAHTLHALRSYLESPDHLDPGRPSHTPARALIRSEDCIGCARCVPACPTRAIVGARRYLHAVVSRDCTGCGLCLPPCPVNCIDLPEVVALPAPWPGGWTLQDATYAHRRYQDRQRFQEPAPSLGSRLSRRQEIVEAVARHRQRRAKSGGLT